MTFYWAAGYVNVRLFAEHSGWNFLGSVAVVLWESDSADPLRRRMLMRTAGHRRYMGRRHLSSAQFGSRGDQLQAGGVRLAEFTDPL
jgi:hypothetical protein